MRESISIEACDPPGNRAFMLSCVCGHHMVFCNRKYRNLFESIGVMMSSGGRSVFVGIAVCGALWAVPASADTMKRTLVPANQRVNDAAITVPAALREPYMIGMLNLIFTHQPKHGADVTSYVLAAYSTEQIIAQGRAVQGND